MPRRPVPLVLVWLGAASCSSLLSSAGSFAPALVARRSANGPAPSPCLHAIRPGSIEEATLKTGRVPYGEEARQYRRTVYEHDEWVQHRSSQQVWNGVKSIFISSIVRQLLGQVALLSFVALGVVALNDVLVPYANATLGWFLPRATLPALPFTLSNSSLGLLLVFKTNSSYQRYSESRSALGRTLTQSRSAVRMALTFPDLTVEENRKAVDRFIRAVWVVNRSFVNRFAPPLEDGDKFEAEIKEAFADSDPTGFVPHILSSNRQERAQLALLEASLVLDGMPIDEKRRLDIDKIFANIGNSFAELQKVYTLPVPLIYTRHTYRFLSIYLLLLPMALYSSFASVASPGAFLPGLVTVPAVALISFFLLGISELALQLEEPLSLLPMQKLCDAQKVAYNVMKERAFDTAEYRAANKMIN